MTCLDDKSTLLIPSVLGGTGSVVMNCYVIVSRQGIMGLTDPESAARGRGLFT